MANKKNSQNKRKQETKKIDRIEKSDMDLWNKVFLVICVIIFFLAFYLLTLYITNKNSSSNDTIEDSGEVSISYDEILLGSSLSMSEEDYLVLYFDNSDEELASTYGNLISTYQSSGNYLRLYYVDMSSGFNQAYTTTEEPNRSPESAGDLRINGPTLIEVSQNQVVDYIEGEADITNYLS